MTVTDNRRKGLRGMSIEENVGQLNEARETLDTAMQQASETIQFGSDALTIVQGVAGGNPPQHLQDAMQAMSTAQHSVEEAHAAYAAASEQIEEYIGILSS